MMGSDSLMFGWLVFLGFITIGMTLYSLKFSFKENKKALVLRTWGMIIVVLGFIVHSLGGVLTDGYGEALEQWFQSIAHVILLVGFIFFLLATKEMLTLAERYGFR